MVKRVYFNSLDHFSKVSNMDNRVLYTISNKWIMRHDEYYGNSYALYNIETRKLARLTASLYTVTTQHPYRKLLVNKA